MILFVANFTIGRGSGADHWVGPIYFRLMPVQFLPNASFHATFYLSLLNQTLIKRLRYGIYDTEHDLLHQFAAGDPMAFSVVYKQFYERVYLYAKRFIDEAAEAEDITADTFVKLWHRKTDFTNLEAISIFLHIAVRNKCYDFLRHTQMKAVKKEELLHRLSDDEQGDFTLELIRSELMKLIYAEVDKLPSKMKEIFRLSYKEGLKPAEIASRLHLSAQTVSNQKTTAIKLLRTALAEQSLLIPLREYNMPVSGVVPVVLSAQLFFLEFF